MNDVHTIRGSDRLIVFGASGTVGAEVARLAVAYGAEVISYTRSGRAPTDEPWTAGVEWRRCDISVEDDWIAALDEATAVVNAISTRGTWVAGIRSACAEANKRLVEIGCASQTMEEALDVQGAIHLRVPRFDDRAETGEVPPSADGVAVGHAAMAALRAAIEEDHAGVLEAAEVAYLGDAMFIQ